MPNTQCRLIDGALMTDHVSNKINGGTLSGLNQVVDIAAIYGTGTAAVSLSAGHVFGILDCFNQTTASIVTLPAASQVVQHLQQIRQGAGATWRFTIAAATSGQTLAILPGTGWNLSGGSALLANLQRVSGQVAEVVCWIVNPAVGSESIRAAVTWSF